MHPFHARHAENGAGRGPCRTYELPHLRDLIRRVALRCGEQRPPKKHNLDNLERSLLRISILPVWPTIPVYAKERCRLERIGRRVDDFDLLIGATAIHHGLTLVTNNTKHFQRLNGIKLEDWSR